ncbi:osmoprotectant ABC transporter substrate-binding protein [Peptococcus simiae]|uniref:Osmoprotectant ABC transporter substrate-binding protein n=1 Tax=Peptococcus simiae TaxID=1643805 RepID=A0ABW9H0B7_9FIRM
MRQLKKLTAALLALTFLLTAGCALPGLGSSTRSGIVVASGSFAERQIMSEMTAEMIRHYLPDVDVSVINNLGSATLVNQSLVHGDANVAGCMYTGTSLTGELNMPPITDPEKAFKAVVDGYDQQFDCKWYNSFGFANTYAFMVTRELAERENLSKVSDLERLKDTLKVGVDTHWLRREGDGYEAFQDIYGFAFNNMHSMELGLVYSAVHAGEVDCVLGYSTDGRINAFDLVLLEDDRHLFPPYDASPVATHDVLERYPELDGVLKRMHGVISSETMQKLNRRSDEDHVEPAIVAKEYLEENNYFEDRGKGDK